MVVLETYSAIFYSFSVHLFITLLLPPVYPALTHFRFVGDGTVKTLIRRNKSFQNLFGLDDRLAISLTPVL